MDFFDTRRPYAHIAPERYHLHVARLICDRVGIDPNTVTGRLNDFLDQCELRLALYKYDQLPRLAAQFEQDMRQVKLDMQRPSDASTKADRESVHGHAAAQGWVSEEIDILWELARGVKITTVTWRGAKLADGRGIDREQVRAAGRYAAYSDDKWAEHLASLPKIQAPSEDPR